MRKSETGLLEGVLARVNQLGDFLQKPAKSAADRSDSGDLPLHKVAIWGDVEAARILLEFGADINAQGEDGDTPLHRSIDQVEMVRFLIAHGADPNIPNRYGSTASEHARAVGNAEIIAALRWNSSTKRSKQ